MKFSHVFSWFARGLLVAVLASAVLARAEPTTFSTSLSPEDKAVTGIARLTEAQVASLDQQVQHEIATAHQGNTVAFSTSFTHRRTPQQRLEAGLDHLMTPELAQLDRLVAAALANRTPPAGPLVTTPATTSSSPNSYVETVTPKLEIHGEVSFSYVSASGGGHGYGSSIVTSVSDPSGATTFTVGVSQFNGKGFRYNPYYPYYYPGDYACDRGW